MRKQLQKPEWMPNPYLDSLTKAITFRLDFDSITYFEQLGQQYGLSAEEMMYMYLRHMAGSGYKANLGILTLKEREALEKSLEAEGGLPLEG